MIHWVPFLNTLLASVNMFAQVKNSTNRKNILAEHINITKNKLYNYLVNKHDVTVIC